MTRAQSSLEFISIFGIGLALILLLGAIFFTISQGATESLDRKQIDNIGDEITSTIDKIYFRGPGNKITLRTKFPQAIENFTIHQTQNGSGTNFSYLNITYIADSNLFSSLYFPSELYITFNCTRCYRTEVTADNIFWHFNESDFSAGQKALEIVSRGEYVTIDFVK